MTFDYGFRTFDFSTFDLLEPAAAGPRLPLPDRLETLARAAAGGVCDGDAMRKALEKRLGRALSREEEEEVGLFSRGVAWGLNSDTLPAQEPR